MKKINLGATLITEDAFQFMSQRATKISHLDLTSCVKAVCDSSLQVQLAIILAFDKQILEFLYLPFRLSGIVYANYRIFAWIGVSLLQMRGFRLFAVF